VTALDVYVLIADDEPMIATIMERIITSMGLAAVKVTDGTQAIETASLRQRHLIGVILDVVMPEANGVEAAEAIRQLFPDVPIVFMSGSIPPELLQRSILIPYVAFLQKPFTLLEAQTLLTPLFPKYLAQSGQECKTKAAPCRGAHCSN
jgi:two-component system cell cycle sensor histidine kinase/response regulator CckA